MGVDVLVDRADQVVHAREAATPQRLAVQVSEEPLDHVQPGCARRREVKMKTLVALGPRQDLRVLVRRVVVADQVHRFARLYVPLDLVQEREPLLMPVPWLATADDRAVFDVHRREQRRRAVTLVVVRHRPATATLHRQARLGAVQRLHLALLITTKHQRVLGRGEVQANNVTQLLDELRIA